MQYLVKPKKKSDFSKSLLAWLQVPTMGPVLTMCCLSQNHEEMHKYLEVRSNSSLW